MSNSPLLAKIRALLNKTVANGCTEAEAMMATTKAAELMDRYGFDASDLNEKEVITEYSYFAPGRHLGDVSKVVMRIAEFCDVKVWAIRAQKNSGGQSKIVFFGKESDIEIAYYMTHLLSNAFETEWRTYFDGIKNTDNHTMHGRAIRASFVCGMAMRINSRLREMKEARNNAFDTTSGKTGHDLVLVKNADVEDAFKALSMKLNKSQAAKANVSNTAAVIAGDAAGSRVNIVAGVNGKETLKIS